MTVFRKLSAFQLKVVVTVIELKWPMLLYMRKSFSSPRKLQGPVVSAIFECFGRVLPAALIERDRDPGVFFLPVIICLSRQFMKVLCNCLLELS